MNAENETAIIEKQWEDNPQLVRQFLERRPDYEQLCSEVSYVLSSKLRKAGIEFAAITARAKTLASFLDKIRRKAYREPLSEITDFAGVRVVCLYSPDTAAIAKVIKDEFEIIEEVDKPHGNPTKEFGYSAKHIVVRLGQRLSGPRYDDIRHFTCEIQIRTVLQDAWAIIQRHLVYKREADVPEVLQRKLNSLSGLLETADDQFDSIRKDRLAYLKLLEESKEKLLAADFNLDSFGTYLKWKFPGRKTEKFSGQANLVFRLMRKSEHPTLKDLDALIEAGKSALPNIEEDYSATNEHQAMSAAHVALFAVAVRFPRWGKIRSQLLSETAKALITKHKLW